MSENQYYNSQHDDSQDSYEVNIPNLELDIKNHWSPYIEKELLAEIKSPTKIRKKSQKSEFKSLCLLGVVTALLSISMYIQADFIVQILGKAARTSVYSTIRK